MTRLVFTGTRSMAALNRSRSPACSIAFSSGVSRSHLRGEINLAQIPASVLAMPFDLVRHDLLMDLEPLAPTRIQSIVDELFLPLVHHRNAGQSSTGI
ncbi:hypothetical protein [Mycolicibacterium mengxianglii]|uniref:hypothetical protein n=1 Tax=Mycolicibacterium mengxianglii TaxID=2736649 RepID=UPI0018D11177|nr:hypothetical protein [Mycolicibacterium mengxianglii]